MTRREPKRPPVCRMCGPWLTVSSCLAYTAGFGFPVRGPLPADRHRAVLELGVVREADVRAARVQQ
jgi:hypothetical protein